MRSSVIAAPAALLAAMAASQQALPDLLGQSSEAGRELRDYVNDKIDDTVDDLIIQLYAYTPTVVWQDPWCVHQGATIAAY